MTAHEIRVILEWHKKWCCGKKNGQRADLQDADLQDADLQDADLRGANLWRANLRDANLLDAKLQDADLRGADLRGADLQGADLLDANLQGANLRDANLRDANLQDANLRGADLRGAENVPDLYFTSIVPESGSFIGWKKVHDKIIKLEVLKDAKRCNATGRKCRCSAAKVLEIQNLDGNDSGLSSITNTNYIPHITYTIGEVVLPDSFDDNRWNECSHGIHFFITRQETVVY